MTLSLDEFGDFMEAVHGYRPFKWQQRLMCEVDAAGRWPDVLDVPTGCGKTTVVDMAVFLMARSPDRFSRRVALVVDRRVIVDQAFQRAVKVARALTENAEEHPILSKVGAALTACRTAAGPDAPVLGTAILRGGMVRDTDWARTPDQPLVIASTVDQVGSRLLFRGYGVADSMKPVHAGLLAHDTTIFLDEVHLSVPFAETLQQLRSYRDKRWAPDCPSPDRWGVVAMSATPIAGLGARWTFELSTNERVEERLRPRLVASKVVADLKKGKVTVRGDEEDRRAQFASRLAAEASQASGQASVIAVIVNRVDTARRVASTLELAGAGEVVLLTGRMRPIDQAVAYRDIEKSVGARVSRLPRTRPLYVVATQSIEAGADFDFDAVVTECASLDALRQRFGRLDRIGHLKISQASILVRHDALGSTADPIYGGALRATWAWLDSLHAVDFGISALQPSLDDLDPESLAKLCSPRYSAPLVLPTHLDLWCQTAPMPRPGPDPSQWLHGPQERVPDVQVVWRADLDGSELQLAAEGDRKALDGLIERLASSPPGSLESIALAPWVVRKWLAQSEEQDSDLADVSTPVPEVGEVGTMRPVVVWAGEDSRVVTSLGDLKPGSTLVVPAKYGGLDPQTRNWDPTYEVDGDHPPPADLGDLVQLMQRGRITLRLHPDLLSQYGMPSTRQTAEGEGSDADDADVVLDWLSEIDASGMDEQCRPLVNWLHGRPVNIMRVGRAGSRTWVVRGRGRLSAQQVRRALCRWEDLTTQPPDDTSTEDDGSAFTGASVLPTIAVHCGGVGSLARDFAKKLALRVELIGDLEFAGQLHDLGKADPRFQLWLFGGNELLEAGQDEPVAKSSLAHTDRAVRERARIAAGYPRGLRHELASLALIEDDRELMRLANDWDLVLHLVASHHGYCRPFPPAVSDAHPVVMTISVDGRNLEASSAQTYANLDSGVPERFWRLVRRYGWYGIAYLEAILRLADHRRSEIEANRSSEGV